MQVFASIRNRSTWIKGSPHTGWDGAVSSDPEAKRLPFDFDITDDGAGNFLLCYSSTDEAFAADDWFESLEQAYSAAEVKFGVRRTEWGPPMPV